MDGFDVWDTISIGKPSPRTEILLNIDLAPEEELYNKMESGDPVYQGAAIRVGDMKLLMSCPNSTWFKPPELGNMASKDTVSEIIPDQVITHPVSPVICIYCLLKLSVETGVHRPLGS